MHCVVAMMTSRLDGAHFPEDVVLQDWQEASLPKPTLVRPTKLVTLDEGLVEKRLGKISEVDTRSVKQSFQKLFSVFL